MWAWIILVLLLLRDRGNSSAEIPEAQETGASEISNPRVINFGNGALTVTLSSGGGGGGAPADSIARAAKFSGSYGQTEFDEVGVT